MTRMLSVVLLVAILMAVTNPEMADFEQHVQHEVARQVREADRAEVLVWSERIQGLTGFDALKWYTEKLLSGAERRDYVVLSLYAAEIDGEQRFWVGAFGRFFALPGGDPVPPESSGSGGFPLLE